MPDIKFTIHQDLVDEEKLRPIPAKVDIPEWFKKVPKFQTPNPKDLSVKSCVPVLDSITAGYLLRLPQDLFLKINFYEEELKEKINLIQFGQGLDGTISQMKGYNLNAHTEEHGVKQVGGPDSLYGKKNFGKNIPKILNPWTITTPPGYSCLFIPPMHRESKFSILPGIVDTDTYNAKINFPFVFNLGKDESLNKLYRIGTPYVQVIPFKRQEWNMSFDTHKDIGTKLGFLHNIRIFDIYKRKFWSKKIWK